MKLTKLFLSSLILIAVSSVNAQSVSAEMVDFQMLKAPKFPIDASSRQFKVTVTSFTDG